MSAIIRLQRVYHSIIREIRSWWTTPHRYELLSQQRTHRSMIRRCGYWALRCGVAGIFILIAILWIVFQSEPGWKDPPTQTNIVQRSSPIFITAASSNHFQSLQYMLYSLRELGAHVIFFNLQLTKEQMLDLITWDGLEIREFDFSKYPKHVDIKVNAGEYAWKSIMITTIMDEKQTDVIWIDAGAYVLELDTITRRLANVDRGLYVGKSKSPGTIRDWTHPGMLTYFNTTMEKWGSYPNIEASLIGIRWNSECIQQVIRPWHACALVKQCIAPEGSSRRNHRQDQSALGFLMSREGYHAIPDRDRTGDHIAGKCDRSFYKYLFDWGRYVSIQQYISFCLT